MTKQQKAIFSINKWIEIAEKGNLDNYAIIEEDIEYFKVILNLIQEQEKEIEKKDKIIDELSYYLSDFDIDEMCIKCEKCIGNGCNADDDLNFKINCIKQYFEKKVEKEYK